MKEQKNIERLFQEKFKDFEAIPPHDAWNNIAARLNEKKKKKRVIPFWFQLSGIAASLAIIGSILWTFQPENRDLTPIDNAVVTEDATTKTNKNTIESNSTNEAITTIEKNKKLIENDLKQDKIDKIIKLKNNLVIQAKENKKSNQSEANSEGIKLNRTLNSKESSLSNKEINGARNYSIQSKEIQNKQQLSQNIKNPLANNLKETTPDLENRQNTSKSSNEIILGTDKEQTKYANNNTSVSKQKNKNQPVLETELNINDSTLVAKIAKEPNPLDELLLAKEEGENEIEKEKRNKWAISTNASPVYFNSVTDRSSIDSKLNANEKSFNNTISFGVGLNYALSKKITIKTGVNNLKIDYNTNDIAFYQGQNASLLKNLDANPMGKLINIESKLVDNGNFVSVLGTPVIKYDAILKQQISFVEIPVELSYKIIDKKFGIDLIGGMSTLFLTENNVSLVSTGQEMNIGKANNLNEIHFSSNVGLGFKYNFWGNFNANFQPMFKYQINTFNDDSRDFKPYFIGLYSGISFSF